MYLIADDFLITWCENTYFDIILLGEFWCLKYVHGYSCCCAGSSIGSIAPTDRLQVELAKTNGLELKTPPCKLRRFNSEPYQSSREKQRRCKKVRKMGKGKRVSTGSDQSKQVPPPTEQPPVDPPAASATLPADSVDQSEATPAQPVPPGAMPTQPEASLEARTSEPPAVPKEAVQAMPENQALETAAGTPQDKPQQEPAPPAEVPNPSSLALALPETAPKAMATAAKSMPVPPKKEVKDELLGSKKEEPLTPAPTVAVLQQAAQTTAHENLRRPETHQQLCSPAPSVPEAVCPHELMRQLQTAQPTAPSGTPTAGGTSTPAVATHAAAPDSTATVAVPKKKREKTVEEKAHHARFMRFTRHIQSHWVADLFFCCIRLVASDW